MRNVQKALFEENGWMDSDTPPTRPIRVWLGSISFHESNFNFPLEDPLGFEIPLYPRCEVTGARHTSR